jgi:Ni/Fe-hydrogenase subunit HybB-like protein
MTYIIVLWLELAPAFLEKWSKEGKGSLAERARSVSRGLDKALPFLLALGLLLPTMHQSSLGTVMLLGGQKLHALWNTPFLPLLFLISCLSMGYAAVVIESSLSSLFFKRKAETPMLVKLSKVAAWSCVLFLAIRFIDLFVRGRGGMLFGSGWLSLFFWLETLAFLMPALIFLRAGSQTGLGRLFQGAMLLAFAGALYRFDAYLIAFDPGGEWSYFPSLTEILITLGIIAIELALYVWIVRRFPILAGDTRSLAGATEGTP